MNILLFFLDQSTVFSSRAVDGHQRYFGDSVVGKASTIGIEISPTPSLIFTGWGVKKCEIWRRLKHHSTSSLTRLKMQQYIRNLKHSLKLHAKTC